MPGLVDPRLNSPTYRRRMNLPSREGLIIYEANFIWEAFPEQPSRVQNYISGRIRPVQGNRVPQVLPVPRFSVQRLPGEPIAEQDPGQQPAQEEENPRQQEENPGQQEENPRQLEENPRQQEQSIQQLSNRMMGTIIEEDYEIDR